MSNEDIKTPIVATLYSDSMERMVTNLLAVQENLAMANAKINLINSSIVSFEGVVNAWAGIAPDIQVRWEEDSNQLVASLGMLSSLTEQIKIVINDSVDSLVGGDEYLDYRPGGTD